MFADPGRTRPAVQLLSNGRYHVMLTSGGGGYSRRNDMAVTRWHEDTTRDNWGMFCYLRDVATGDLLVGDAPTHAASSRKATKPSSPTPAPSSGPDLDFDTHMEIVVSPEDDIELRRLHLTNRAPRRRTIEITSYAEVVLRRRQRRDAPGLQQAVRADRIAALASGHRVHPQAAGQR